MRNCNELPSYRELHEYFAYDPETGILYWKKSFGNFIEAGMTAGSPRKKGHLGVQFKNRAYMVHRIIWKMVTGKDPIDEIDHEDNNPSNNKFDNLREATSQNNNSNCSLAVNNTSGVKGVNWNSHRQKWQARIAFNYKRIHIGFFDNFEEAVQARHTYADKLYGKFANETVL